MATDVQHPEIRHVVPPTRLDGTPTGQEPRMRHHPGSCSHFTESDGSMLGEPVPATPEQMLVLPACKHCVDAQGGSGGARADRDGAIGETCPSCQLALPLTGVCDDCA